MFDKYLKVLNSITIKLTNKDNILSFLNVNKWKILTVFLFVKSLETMYTVYQRGRCTNCEPPTAEQLKDFGGDVEKWTQYNSKFTFLPYTDVNTYFSDLLLPLIFNLSLMGVGMFIIYILYRIVVFILKYVKVMVNKKIKNEYEEALKRQRKK